LDEKCNRGIKRVFTLNSGTTYETNENLGTKFKIAQNSGIDTWQTVNIWTENVTEVPNGFLPLTQVPPMKQMKIQVLNLKQPKTQVPIRYLTLIDLV
jgi:hypothetical protein